MTIPAPDRRRWSKSDSAFLLRLPAGLILAWACSETSWNRVAHKAARRIVRPQRRGETLRRLQTVLGQAFTVDEIARIHHGGLAARTARNLQFLRCHQPRPWAPAVAVEGGEHLAAALARGHGAILWVTPFAYASLLTKLTLRRYGLPLTHLSRSEHGPARTRWGMVLLNPIQRRAEDGYLHERVVIAQGQSPVPAMRRLRRHLAENRAVSITLGSEGIGAVAAPFLNGTAAIATGPIKLAHATGAALLLAHTVATAPDRFATTLEPVLVNPAMPLAEMVARVARLVSRRALLEPEQFFWPGGLIVSDTAPA